MAATSAKPEALAPRKRKAGATLADRPATKRKVPKGKRHRPPPAEETVLPDVKENQAEMAALEMMLFGSGSSGISDVSRFSNPRKTIKRAADTGAAKEDEDILKSEDEAKAPTNERTAKAAWHDPDDEKLMVNISLNPKLRKLRLKEGEALIRGDEYQRRLQGLHEELVGRTSGLSWIDEARKRKKQGEVTNFDNEGVDETPLSGLTSTGQEAFLSKGDQLVLAAGSKFGNRRITHGQTAEPLAPGKIRIRRLEDANKNDPSLSAVSSVEFHPTSNILLTAGRDKKLRLFMVDGQRNALLESLHLKEFPILAAKFAQNNGGASIFAISNANKSIGEYDLQSGKLLQIPGVGNRSEDRCFHFLELGPAPEASASSVVKTFAVASAASQSVIICDSRSKRVINVLQMNAPVAGIAYHPHRSSIFTSDAEASVYEWDICSGRCTSKIQDNSCLKITSMAVSAAAASSYNINRPSSILALGSQTGFVDLFKVPFSGSVGAQPLKVLGNLSTAATTLCFHPSNEILCIVSKWKKNALRLVHLPSMTVFQNWPTQETPMHYATSANFSKRNGLFAIGNDKGSVLLYQLKHFS